MNKTGTGRRRRSMAGQSAKAGLPPGTLVHVGERKTERPEISLIEYDAGHLNERRFATLAEARGYQPALPLRWLNVHGLHEPEVLAEIGHRFGLHPLVLEDILNTAQRPKIDDYGDYLYIVTRFFDIDPASGQVASEQVSLILGRDFVLSFQERPTGRFAPVRERLRQDRGQIRRMGVDYLAYSLLDAVVDRYFAVLEHLGERTEELEELMLANPRPTALSQLHHLKREALVLRRAIWPLREVINSLTRADDRFFRDETRPYLRDLYDHTVHALESLEATRDLIAGMLDIYLSSVSNRVNQEVRALTVIAIIFMPSTLISGIFGMNFHHLPLLERPDGFFLALGMMVAVAVVLGVIFWRRQWLR